jgi:hypothetical protein
MSIEKIQIPNTYKIQGSRLRLAAFFVLRATLCSLFKYSAFVRSYPPLPVSLRDTTLSKEGH